MMRSCVQSVRLSLPLTDSVVLPVGITDEGAEGPGGKLTREGYAGSRQLDLWLCITQLGSSCHA
jgi:hypothetical protein